MNFSVPLPHTVLPADAGMTPADQINSVPEARAAIATNFLATAAISNDPAPDSLVNAVPGQTTR